MTGQDDDAGAGSRTGQAPAEGGRRVSSKAAEPCPICGKPALTAFRPFCSQRCADVDLGRWLGERYVIPGSDFDDEDGRA